MTPVRALRVTAYGHAELLTVEPTLPNLQALVGGWLEGVGSANDPTWHAYCDEDGKGKGLAWNPGATALARRLGWPEGDVLAGPVIFLGSGPGADPEDGPYAGEADVTQAVLDLAAELGAHIEEVNRG